jgi:hypothetical protein
VQQSCERMMHDPIRRRDRLSPITRGEDRPGGNCLNRRNNLSIEHFGSAGHGSRAVRGVGLCRVKRASMSVLCHVTQFRLGNGGGRK